MNQKAYIICGPTASGKSSMAINLALESNGVSQQVYRELPILTACPTQSDYETVPHKLYQFYDGAKRMDASIWIEYAKQEIETALKNNRTPYIVGGTGFYIKALTEGLSVIPTIPENIREQVRREGAHAKNADLYAILQKYDPDLCKKVKPSDKQRVLRGIEVFRATGTPLSAWQKQKKIRPLPNIDFDLKIIDFECTGLGVKDYAIQISAFKNIYLENLCIIGNKDGVHLGWGDGFVIKNGKFYTEDRLQLMNVTQIKFTLKLQDA